MKTEPYDPEKHGDGYSRMVPMSVQPPSGHVVVVYYEHYDPSEKTFSDTYNPLAGIGWTFRPSTPETEKSYAPWVKNGRFYYKGIVVRALLGAGEWIDPIELSADPQQAVALRDWLNDKYPLAEQGAGK
jgi:hypothetical protein